MNEVVAKNELNALSYTITPAAWFFGRLIPKESLSPSSGTLHR